MLKQFTLIDSMGMIDCLNFNHTYKLPYFALSLSILVLSLSRQLHYESFNYQNMIIKPKDVLLMALPKDTSCHHGGLSTTCESVSI